MVEPFIKFKQNIIFIIDFSKLKQLINKWWNLPFSIKSLKYESLIKTKLKLKSKSRKIKPKLNATWVFLLMRKWWVRKWILF